MRRCLVLQTAVVVRQVKEINGGVDQEWDLTDWYERPIRCWSEQSSGSNASEEVTDHIDAL